MGGVTGDFAALQRMQQKLGRMVGVPQRVASIVAPKVAAASQATFTTKTNLYGDAWKPISPKTMARGTSSILIRSGVLFSSISAIPLGTRIKMMLGTGYAKYHISTGRNPFPRGRLPPAWGPMLKEETAKAFKAIAEGTA